MREDTVRVAVRVRPLVSAEVRRGCQNSINVITENNQLHILGTDNAFTFNHVFDPDVDHGEFYAKAVKNMIPNIFKGYNVTILAYGQTGSGKTHTMGTNYSGKGAMGVIPRAIHDIFTTIENKKDYSFKVSVSFMELYKEQLYDLLAGDKAKKDCIVDIREEYKEIKIVGITKKEVNDAHETLMMLVQGSQGRATGATVMNNQSSRSHAIFTIFINQQRNNDINSATVAKFHLVDLAGSERSKKTGATGERFKEGVNINRGLLALGNVISQLSEGNGNTYIAYRDSKLTRLLQDSLGGNSVTLMVACVSPADYNLDETLSTLRYADRAKKIKNKPIVNQDPKTAEINRLKVLLREHKLGLLGQGTVFTCPPEHTHLLNKIRELQKKLHLLMNKFDTNLINTMCMNERSELAERAKEKLCMGLKTILEEFKIFLRDETLTENQHCILKEIYCKLTGLIDHQKKIDVEIMSHILCSQTSLHLNKSQNSLSCEPTDEDNNCQDESLNDTNELDEEHEEHTLRQAERENEVQTINRELALKEELVLKLLLNNALELTDQTKEIQDMKNEMKNLQAEKEQLVKTLENMQASSASAKLAETGRKKVQELEKKISDLSRKCIEQNRIIKSKEKSDQKIDNLTSEIQYLKQTRVKLVREMRKEAEKFRDYKFKRDRELHKLKDQDRKRQNQIVRMQTQHSKQKNVSERKMEEACAVIKRLKEDMERYRQAQIRREKSKTSKEEVITWISQDISILLNTKVAKCSLEKLMQDHALLAIQLEEFEQSYKDKPTPQLKNKITDLSEYIELRNIQISELQRKIIEVDDENRKNSRLNTIQSLDDARIAIEMLSKTNVESKKKYYIKCYEHDKLMDKQEQLLMNLRKYELKEANRQHRDNYSKIPETNVTNVDEDKDIEIVKLKRELEILNEQLQASRQPKKPQNPRVAQLLTDDPNILDSFNDSIVGEDDVENDPDWRKTPLHKRSRTILFKNISDTSNEVATAKRTSDGETKCACRTKCTSRNCSCHKHMESCGKNCGCNPEQCQNRNKCNMSRPYFNAPIHDEIEVDSNKRPRISNS